MLRRGLCLVLAMQMALSHLPVRVLCAPAADDPASLTPVAHAPGSPACPCNPTAAKCECCCSEGGAKQQPTGPAFNSCNCHPHDGIYLAPDTLFANARPSFTVFAAPRIGQVIESRLEYASIDRTLDPPPPRS